MDFEKGQDVFFAHILPKWDIYECIQMRVRTIYENMVVLANSNITYTVHSKDYDKLIYEDANECKKYLKEQKKLNKDTKVYGE